MLLNPTGGVLGGDHLVTEIIQEPDTHVCLDDAFGDANLSNFAGGPRCLKP